MAHNLLIKLKQKRKEIICDGLLIIGISVMTYGVWQYSPRLALVVLGGLLALIGVLLSR